jgi:hypothetical protein
VNVPDTTIEERAEMKAAALEALASWFTAEVESGKHPMVVIAELQAELQKAAA